MAGTQDGTRSSQPVSALGVLLLSLLAVIPVLGAIGATRTSAHGSVVAAPSGQGRTAAIAPASVHFAPARRSSWGNGRAGLIALAALLFATWSLRNRPHAPQWRAPGVLGTLRLRGPPTR